ncbi:Crp/Fnr family transcriptional regulator [Clostridium cylindrosporum]|nr:Crp/Fnr family transcriptional regulator [Clostridium cylindrosporum]
MDLQEIVNILVKVNLFRGIEREEILKIIPCLDYRVKSFDKGANIFQAGDTVNNIGIVLSGSCEISKENVAGNKIIVAMLSSEDMFAESIVCRKNKISPVNVTSIENSKIIFISYDKIIRSCDNSCGFHVNLINNLLVTIAEKNYILNNKIDILLLKSMREKIATFLLNKQKQTGSFSFNIEINRNQLAEYLNVCRSALSRELSRMKEENIIDFYKNTFKIKDIESLKKIIQ